MTPEQLSEIEARLKAASPGPWRQEEVLEYPNRWGIHSQNDIITGITRWSPTQTSAIGPEKWDADFIIHAPSDIAALLGYVRKLEERIEQLEDHGWERTTYD